MMHRSRCHRLHVIAESVSDSAIATLAEKLTQHDWTGCTGFRLGELLFLNDATSADGAQEYAVFRAAPNADGTHTQIESLTCSWMTQEKCEQTLRALFGLPVEPARNDGPVLVAFSVHELQRALGSAAGVNMGSYKLQPHPEGACILCA